MRLFKTFVASTFSTVFRVGENRTFTQFKLPYFMLYSSGKIMMDTVTNLIRRIHRLYSSFSFSALGNLKYLQVWLSDEWLHDGAKQ